MSQKEMIRKHTVLEWIVYYHLTKLFHCEALAHFVRRNKTILSPTQPETIFSLGQTICLILEMGEPL